LDEIRPGYVAVGRVLSAWGLRGELKIDPMAPDSTLATTRTVCVAGGDYAIERSLRSGRFVRLKIKGVDTREQARLLRGFYVQAAEVDLELLPEGEFYRFQLIGLAVRSLDGHDLGIIVDVLSTLENDVYVVNGPQGEVLLPAVEDVVRDVDLAARVMTIEVIPGLLP
jgi:16S rRNA processing protein RimM